MCTQPEPIQSMYMDISILYYYISSITDLKNRGLVVPQCNSRIKLRFGQFKTHKSLIKHPLLHQTGFPAFAGILLEHQQVCQYALG